MFIKKRHYIITSIFLLCFGGPLYVLFSGQLELNQHWSTANRTPANIAPSANNHQAIVNIYAARAYGYRGMFAVHSWIAVKTQNAKEYTIYQGFGWNLWRHRPIVDVKNDIPDRYWYGHRPQLLLDLRGEQAAVAIKQIKQAIKHYPYKNQYRVWPGPNSNTFVAYVLRHSPALKVGLPVTAIGKDYAPSVCHQTPSNTGWQCSLKGIVSFSLAKVEGIEFNILGFGFALNTIAPYIHLPGIG